MELFAGSAGLSSEVRKAGFRVIAIDHEFNRHSPKVSLISLDLTLPHAQKQVLEMLRTLKPMSVHLGLPCGTCSRARERALPSNLKNDYHTPQPLRDAAHLLGFPWLTGSDRLKVQSANVLYKFAVQLLFVCWELGIYPSIENPTRSWLWGVLVLLVAEIGNNDFTRWFGNFHKTTFHACMHGSQRNKQTSLLAPAGLFDELEAECDRSHSHLPWEIKPMGKRLSFATADEAAYPNLLCSRMAECLRKQAERLHVDMTKQVSFTKQSKHALGHQTTSAKPLIPEFSQFHHCDKPCNMEGYRLLASPPTGENTDLQDFSQTVSQSSSKRTRRTYKYGVQWEPNDFLEKAKTVQHPKNPHNALPDVLKEALLHIFSSDPVELAKHRLQVVLAIKRKSEELATREKELKRSMEPKVANVLASKRLLLWKNGRLLWKKRAITTLLFSI